MRFLPRVCTVSGLTPAMMLEPLGVMQIIILLCVFQPLAASQSGTWKPTAGPNFPDSVEAIAQVRAWLIPTDGESSVR